MVGRTLPTPTILYATFCERAMLRAMIDTAVLFFQVMIIVLIYYYTM